MKILLTGATGYIGKRLLPVLIEQGHKVICCVRDKNRFPTDGIFSHSNVSLFEVDFLTEISLSNLTAKSFPRKQESIDVVLKDDHLNENNFPEVLLKDIDAAYYLIHSMNSNVKDFSSLEETSANNFIKLVKLTSVKQIIYLGGITNEEKLSRHLSSRKRVEEILAASGIPLTSLKAGIIVGSGSA
ncbi:MAG: NmrA family NAD(P)-binding protein, partial [Ignavibacteriaceae bacterium]